MDNDDIANALFNSLRSIKMQMVNCTEDIDSLKYENNDLKRTVVLLQQQLQQQSTEICFLKKNINVCAKTKVSKKVNDKEFNNIENQKHSVELCLPKLRTLAFHSIEVKDLSSTVLTELYKCRQITLSYCYFLRATEIKVMQVVILKLHPKEKFGRLKQILKKVYDEEFDFGRNYTYISPQQTYKHSTDFIKDFGFYDDTNIWLHSSKTSMLFLKQSMISTNEQHDLCLANALLCHRIECKHLSH